MNVDKKVILKRIIPEAIWKNARICYMRQKSRKCASKMIRYYGKHMDELNEEQSAILDVIKNEKRVRVFYYTPANISRISIDVEFDDEHKLFYAKLNQRRLYLRKSVTSADEARRYVLGILREQDMNSPHRYVPEGVHLHGRLIDLGAAEGWFAFNYQDEVDDIFLVEYDDEWIEALKLTFKDRSNVHIIKKYISDVNQGMEITMDTLLKEYPGKVGCVKMDIEGAEQKCLAGAKKMVRDNPQCVYFICTYHKKEDETVIKKIFENRNIEMSKGYMLMYESNDFETPFFRKGVMRVL